MRTVIAASFLLVACSSTTPGTGANAPQDGGREASTSDPPDAGVDAPADVTSDVPKKGSPPEGRYFMSCLPVLAQGDPRLAIKFKVLIGAGGLFTIAPLTRDAQSMNDLPADHVPRSKPVQDGVVAFGDFGIPAASNPMSESPIAMEDVKLTFKTSSCAELDGMIVAPSNVDLNGSGDVCLLRRVEGDSLPALAKDDFHCP
jgi:hypothetical protein